jgi:hypothetical protein
MKRLALLLVAGVVVAGLFLFSGPALVVDRPERSDAIIVLGGDRDDIRYRRGLELLRAGYGRRLLLNAANVTRIYGRTAAEYAAEFVDRSAGSLRPQIEICPFSEDSTLSETKYVDLCMRKLEAQSGLLVTSPAHTRRALSIFRARLPQYRWSVAAAPDSEDWGPRWWQRRQWAKTHLAEWERMIWWQMVDRWRP